MKSQRCWSGANKLYGIVCVWGDACVCACVCVHACVRACVCACVPVYVRACLRTGVFTQMKQKHYYYHHKGGRGLSFSARAARGIHLVTIISCVQDTGVWGADFNFNFNFFGTWYWRDLSGDYLPKRCRWSSRREELGTGRWGPFRPCRSCCGTAVRACAWTDPHWDCWSRAESPSDLCTMSSTDLHVQNGSIY